MYFASTMVMVSIALVMAVIVTNIYAKKDTPVRCPRWTARLASWFYPVHYFPQSQPEVLERPMHTIGPRQHTAQSPRQTKVRPTADVKQSRDGGNNVHVIGSCGLCHGDNDVTLPSSQRSPAAMTPMTPEQFDFELSQAEWRIVAKLTDRAFFWLFLTMSLLTHINLFLQMIPQTRSAV